MIKPNELKQARTKALTEAHGVSRKSGSAGSVSDSAMIDWMEKSGNGLWMNPSTQLWECDDGSDREGFQTIREAIQLSMEQNDTDDSRKTIGD